IYNLIAKSFSENPDNYAQECQVLQYCRQDAVKGAGSNMTGRDLLYKYFGQLEILEMRFPEICVNFLWNDTFINKLTIQTAIA
ncbi:BRO1 domain-containing protein, partial [Suillus occidentalis]